MRKAVPELAERILTEPGWYALAATLTDAEAIGHEPTDLLGEAAVRRELDSADSISDVLIWRLRRAADLPADATATHPRGSANSLQPRAPTQVTTQQERPRRGR